MGSNEIKLVEGYLKLVEELESADSHQTELIQSKMEGIVFAYETYVSAHWETFDALLKKYVEYVR